MTFLALLAMLLPAIFPVAIFFLLRKKQKIVARVFLIIGVALALSIIGLWALELSGVKIKNHFNLISHILENDLALPEDIQQQKYLLAGMSNAAEALSKYSNSYPEEKEKALNSLENIVQFVTDEARYPDLSNKRAWKNNIFYLIQVNTILHHYELATTQDTFHDLNQKISKYLSAQIIRSPYKHLPSFEKDATYWTADNAQLLAGLRHFDKLTLENTSHRAIEGWTSFCKRELRYDDSQLPCSAFTAKQKCREAPHGTQLANTIASLSVYDMDLAKTMWKQYKHYYKRSNLNVFATFDQYHPKEQEPAYDKQRLHPYDGIPPQIASLKTAAYMGDKLTYFQLANQLWLHDILHANDENKLAPEYRWKAFYEKCLLFCGETAF